MVHLVLRESRIGDPQVVCVEKFFNHFSLLDVRRWLEEDSDMLLLTTWAEKHQTTFESYSC